MFDRFSWTRNKIEELTKDKLGAQIVDIGCSACPITREMTNCIWVDCQSYETIAELIRKEPVLLYDKDPTTGRFSTLGWKPGGAPPIPREKFVQANAESLPFEDKQFEVAVATQLLAYPENPVAVLKEIKRIVNQAIITVRNEKDWDPRYRTSQPTDMRFYTEDMLRQQLKEAEIDNYSFERLDYNGWSFFAVVISSRIRARFIGGIGATGAGIVREWLNSHPDVYSFGQTGFILNKSLYNLTPESLSQARNFTYNDSGNWHIFSSSCERQILDQALSEVANSLVHDDLLGNRKKIGNFIDKVFTGLAQLNNKVTWVEHTPVNIFCGERLREYFGDEFRIISVEREPRDNICCIAFNKKHWGPNDLFGAIDYWALNTKYALLSMSRIPERLYMRVSYEDFVYNQVAVGRKICQFLEIPWHKNFEAPITNDKDIGRYKREFRLESTPRLAAGIPE